MHHWNDSIKFLSEYVCLKIKQIELLNTCFHEITNPNFAFSVIFSQTHSFEKATIKQTRLTLIGWNKLENSESDIGNSWNYVVSSSKIFCQIIYTYGKLITKNVNTLITKAVNLVWLLMQWKLKNLHFLPKGAKNWGYQW